MQLPLPIFGGEALTSDLFRYVLKKNNTMCYFWIMSSKISHDRNDETIEAKTKWFQSLSLSDRMDLLCTYTDLALELNPQLPDKKYAQQAKGRIQILSKG